jgi:phenylacetate-CoA ligase
MAKITGRSDDMMIVRGVNVFPSQIEELILAMPKLSPQYQLTLMREGHLDSLAVCVEARAELCSSLGDGDRASLARELQQRIKTMVGISTSVSILRTGEIPTTATGKAKRVVDLRNTPKSVS